MEDVAACDEDEVDVAAALLSEEDEEAALSDEDEAAALSEEES